MAQLAIKGHPTRGKEVIEILEMMGGRTAYLYNGDDDDAVYFIDGLYIMAYKWEDINREKYSIFTLEKFLEKFPYKVGDKVQRKGATSCGTVYEIEQIKWEDNQVKYIICDLYWKNCKCTVTSEDLQPYKEETMEELRIDFPEGYGYAGIENKQVIFTKIKPQYPKTYEKCYKIVYPNSKDVKSTSVNGHYWNSLQKLSHLLLCRDAYWKIAGEQMGLGKPWEPDWLNTNSNKYCIYYVGDEIKKQPMLEVHHPLAFPTVEMRDEFFENFKELIEQCKELL